MRGRGRHGEDGRMSGNGWMEGKRAGERGGEYGRWSVQRKKDGLRRGRERIYIIEHEHEAYGGGLMGLMGDSGRQASGV